MSYNVIFLNDVAVSEPDDISRSERQLLLSVLINLNKFLRLRSTKVEDDTGEIIDGQIQETFPKSDLESKYCSRDFVGIIFPAACMCHDMTGRRAIHPRTGVAHAMDKMLVRASKQPNSASSMDHRKLSRLHDLITEYSYSGHINFSGPCTWCRTNSLGLGSSGLASLVESGYPTLLVPLLRAPEVLRASGKAGAMGRWNALVTCLSGTSYG